MKTLTMVLLTAALLSGAVNSAAAQSSAGIAPLVIPVEGQVTASSGAPASGSVVLKISIYRTNDDPNPLWVENQIVALDQAGRYAVEAGASLDAGLPSDLFSDGSARWIGVAIDLEPERPRMMLLSVPYAAKAASADTLAGKPASDFVLNTNFTEQVRTALAAEGGSLRDGEDPTSNLTTNNYLQKGLGDGGPVTNSTVYESSDGNVGIGTTSPAVKLQVEGTVAGTTFANGRVGSFKNLTGASKYTTLYFTDAVTSDAYMGFFSGTSQANARFFFSGTGATEDFVVRGNGNVGIGTTSPTVKLEVEATVAGTTFANGRVGSFKNLTGASKYTTLYFTDAVTSDAYMGFFSGTSQANARFFFSAGTGAEDFVVQGNGNVGIGTTSPTSKLHVVGAALVTGDLTVDGNIAAKYQDVAEWVDSTEPFEPGTVVVIDTTAKNRVTASARAYDSRVAGAISPQPGLLLGEPGPGKVLVAQSGRVRIKADARYGAIRAGDLVVSSPRKGYAMRSKMVKVGDMSIHRPGTVLGKALEPLAAGSGEILVLLTLQ